jgi:hypothetical protein
LVSKIQVENLLAGPEIPPLRLEFPPWNNFLGVRVLGPKFRPRNLRPDIPSLNFCLLPNFRVPEIPSPAKFGYVFLAGTWYAPQKGGQNFDWQNFWGLEIPRIFPPL